MWLVGHMQVGWLGGWLGGLERRDRSALAWAGALPDLDTVTLLGGQDAYYAGHHVYLHNLSAALLLPLFPALLARRKLVVYLGGGVSVLLHLLSDSGGLLPLRPLWPFATTLWWLNGGSWTIAALSEIGVPAVLLAWQLAIFVRHRRSVLEALGPRAEPWLVARLRLNSLREREKSADA